MRQLSLFKGKRQKGIAPPLPLEFATHATLADICKCTIYITDIRYRESVYRVLGERLRGVFPAFTGLVVVSLARPEWVVEVDVIAVLP